MKNTRKFLAIFMVIAMIMSMGVLGAFAANGNSTTTKGSITIAETAAGTTYTIYRIFELESFNTEPAPDGAYSYKVDEQWADFFKAAEGETPAGEGLNYVDISDKGYVTWKTGANQVDFATKAQAYAEANNITNDGTYTSEAGNEEHKFTDLALGYYLIDSSLGALCALDTTNPDVIVNEKNAGHNLDKDVKEDSTSTWGDQNDASIGEVVEFKATITISGAVKELVMHDTMTSGLTYGSVTKVTLNDNEVVNAENDIKYVVTPSASHTDDKGTEATDDTTETHTFDVDFTEAFEATLKTGDVIVVYYTATVNENAVVATAEVNKSNLSYKDNNNETHETTDSETKTFTWEIDVLKYANGVKTNVLAGAKFKLSTDAEGTKVINFKVTDTNVYEVVAAAGEGTVAEITTDATGKFNIEGLDSGTYYLTETEAPVGYNKLGTVVEVQIVVQGQNSVTKVKGQDGAYVIVDDVEVNNNAGTELPSTGSIGTTIFYVAGGIMVVAAVIFLVTKKRMKNAEN